MSARPLFPTRYRLLAALVAGGLVNGLVSGCAGPAGPDYHGPLPVIADRWSAQGWRAAHPADTESRGPWWLLYHDKTLDALEDGAQRDSPSLQGALARVRQAEALVDVARGGGRPQIAASASSSRSRTSANRPLATPGGSTSALLQNDFTAGISLRWETDLAGGVQRSVEAAQAAAGQALADAQTVRLLISANIASNYFAVRAIDADVAQLEQLLALQQRGVALAQRRADLGLGTALDVATQQALLDGTRVQLEDLRVQRGGQVAALAALTGQPAPDFRLEPLGLALEIPRPPLGVPSDLLERRPDIGSAERAVAQASAQIGVASAALYPDLTLGASAGSDSRTLQRLLQAPSLAWTVGASVVASLYDGGRIAASIEAARAAHEASVAHYRDIVLTAMAEVEGALSAEQALTQAAERQEAVLATTRQQLALVSRRHQSGLGTAVDMLAAEQSVRIAERGAVQLRGQRLTNSITLVKALGGGWGATQR
jgi:NodT family efflux transporter outer membrane factor (OMF) lipoprotein